MSIKGFRILWIKLQIENRRFLSIPLPIPLYLFWELLDGFHDLLTAICFFVPKVPDPNSRTRFTVYSVKGLVANVMKLLDSFNQKEPFDFVDVTADKVKVLIKIR